MALVSKNASTARKSSELRRQVFKHTLEKPYTITWPTIDDSLQSLIVDMLCKDLEPLGKYYAESQKRSKRRSGSKNMKKHRKGKGIGEAKQERPVLENEEMKGYVTIGINSTTRALERQACGECESKDYLVAAFVCRADIDPQLVSHIPALAYAASIRSNNKNGSSVTRIVGLPKGSEALLAKTIHQRCVSAIGIKVSGVTAKFSSLIQKVQELIEPPSVPWIGNKESSQQFMKQMVVRELHTTAPIINKKNKTVNSQQQTADTLKKATSSSKNNRTQGQKRRAVDGKPCIKNNNMHPNKKQKPQK